MLVLAIQLTFDAPAPHSQGARVRFARGIAADLVACQVTAKKGESLCVRHNEVYAIIVYQHETVHGTVGGSVVWCGKTVNA